MQYTFKVHKEGNGYWSECLDLHGCVTQGDTKAQLAANMEEALNLYLDEPVDSEIIPQLPKKHKPQRNHVKVPVEPQLALSLLIKHARKQKGLTQKQAASKLGMKNIYSYQRLENSKTNPSLVMLMRLKKIFPTINIDSVIL